MSNRSAVIPAKFARLVVQNTAIPTPQADQILLRIHATAVNPVDYKIQSAGRFFEEFPRVLGSDAAGTVEGVGPEQKRFKKGDKVFSFVPIFASSKGETTHGTFQQYSLTDDSVTAILPSNTSYESACTIPLALSTAADGFYDFLGLRDPVNGTPKTTDEWILIWGGASSVGQFAIQLAKASGYRVITTASASGHSDLKALGATTTLDYHDSDIIEQIIKATDGNLKLVYDAVATKESVAQTLEVLKNGGGKAAYTQLTPETAELESPSNVEYYRVFAGNLQGKNKALGRKIFDWASKALEEGTLVGNPVKLRQGGVDGVQETLDYYREHGINNGKYVLNP